jgi:cytochrome oxidase assembly protein ShyY1
LNIFSDMKIGTRLGLAFGAVLLITALISGMGIWRLNTLKVASEELATVELERNSQAQAPASRNGDCPRQLATTSARHCVAPNLASLPAPGNC